MTARDRNDRRGAERYAPPKPVPGTFGGFEAKILELSLTGCRIEHGDRLPPKAKLPLRFLWRGTKVRVEGTVIRSELTFAAGKPVYVSGLEFCDSPEASPQVIRDVVGWLMAAAKKAAPPVVETEETEEEPEVLSAKYLRCQFMGGQWSKIYVDDAAQPSDGFTIRAPTTESEADVLCRAYEKADATKRRTMCASFQRDIERGRA